MILNCLVRFSETKAPDRQTDRHTDRQTEVERERKDRKTNGEKLKKLI